MRNRFPNYSGYRSYRTPYNVRGVRLGKYRWNRSCAMGPSNGRLCLCCLRRNSFTLKILKKEKEEYTCTYCNSTNNIIICCLSRIPRRSASKSIWKKFIQEHTLWTTRGNDTPEDFMREV